jgi:transposase InsO family protein
MDDHHFAELVVDALTMALRRSPPDPTELIHHSDKGGEYLSNDLAVAAGSVDELTRSFGRTGDALDNAAMDTVWGSMKREVEHIRGSTPFATRDEARTYLFEHIGSATRPASDTSHPPPTPRRSWHSQPKPRVRESGGTSNIHQGPATNVVSSAH